MRQIRRPWFGAYTPIFGFTHYLININLFQSYCANDFHDAHVNLQSDWLPCLQVDQRHQFHQSRQYINDMNTPIPADRLNQWFEVIW